MSDSNDTELVVSSDDKTDDEEANVVGLLRDRTGLIYHRLPAELCDHFDDLVGEKDQLVDDLEDLIGEEDQLPEDFHDQFDNLADEGDQLPEEFHEYLDDLASEEDQLPEDFHDHLDDLVSEEGRSDSGIYARFTPFRYEDELQRRDVFGIKLHFGSDVTGEQTNERVVQRLDTRYGVVRYPYDLAYMTDLHTRAEDVSTEEPATSQPANDGTVEASEDATEMVMPGDRISDTDPKTRVSFEQVDEQTLAVRFDPPLNVWKPDAGFQPHPDIEPARVNLQRIPVEEERRSDTGETLGDIGKWRLILPIEYRDGYDLTASRRANKTDGTPVELALTVDSKTDTPAIVHNPDPATDHEGRLRTVGQSTGGRPEDDVAVDQHHIHVSKALVNGLGLGTTYEGSRSVALIPYESCFTLVPTSGPYAFTGSL